MRGDRFTKWEVTLRIAVSENFTRRVAMQACRDTRPNLERKFVDCRKPILKRLKFCNRPRADTSDIFCRKFFPERRQAKRRVRLFLHRSFYGFGLEQIVWEFCGDKSSRTALAVEIAFGDKLFVCVQDRDARDAPLARQSARRGKAFPRGEFAAQDRRANRLVNLPVKRPT